MVPGTKIQLDTPALGFATNLRQQVIPAASVIEIVSMPTKHKKIIDVLWDGEPLTMFVHDLDVAEPNLLNSGPDSNGRTGPPSQTISTPDQLVLRERNMMHEPIALTAPE